MEIVRGLENGIKQADLAKRYGVSPAMLSVLNKNRGEIIHALASFSKNSRKNRKCTQVDLVLL